MAEFQIKRATRSQTKLRLAFTGASFGGKTTASILLAKGLVDAMVACGQLPASMDARIGLIDSERKRAQLYSHLTPFDTIELDPPFSVERYLTALHQFEAAGYPVIIIDSASHAWMGQGGVLSMMKGSDNSFAEWKKATPVQDEFIDSIMRSPAHMIVTMRSKTEWVVEKVLNKQGREVNAPRRIGMAPVQRSGVEYEFTTLLDLQIQPDKARKIEVYKDNTGVFIDLPINAPSDWTVAGKRMIQWMNEGAVPVDQPIEPTAADKAEAQCAAAERMMARMTTLPDLARFFDSTQKTLREYVPTLGKDIVGPLLQRVIDAKDARKAALSAPDTAPEVTGPTIGPDDGDTIEALMMLGGVLLKDFQLRFGIQRICQLPDGEYENAVTWIIDQAGANGNELARPARVVPKAPSEPAPKAVANGVLNRIISSKNDLASQA